MKNQSRIPVPDVSVVVPTTEEQKTDSSIFTRLIDSPLGELILGATDLGLCLLEFADRRSLATEIAILQKLFRRAVVPGTNRYLDQIADELSQYFDGRLTKFSTPLEKRGTPFQLAVWDELLKIPYGKTISYARLAESMGRPGAQRAVGRANGDNKIAIIVPCHRVVQVDGGLRGYGGGLWRKRYLLELESRQPTRLPVVPSVGKSDE
jgi:AraC family transcriptional regulator of adaptative response/methylated-DNA-[protein]-cysteine methyltransferase